MSTIEIPQLIPRLTRNPEPAHPGLERKVGYVPNFRERTASKKVDDISRHESKHDLVPKHDPKPNAREKTQDWTKPGAGEPLGGLPATGTVNK